MNFGRAFGENVAPHRPPETNNRLAEIVTLAFVSENLPASLISHTLAKSLASETGANVILARFEAENSEAWLRHL